jgi:hypothetical protein
MMDIRSTRLFMTLESLKQVGAFKQKEKRRNRKKKRETRKNHLLQKKKINYEPFNLIV